MKLLEISIAGYKSLAEEQSIAFKPLTILAGGNSGGKSSFMQPLLMMKQTLESSFDPGALLIQGEHVKFNDINQFFSKIGKKQASSFFIKFKYENNREVTLCYKKTKKIGVKIDCMLINGEFFKNFKIKENIKFSDNDDISKHPRILSYKSIDKGFNIKVYRDKCLLKIKLIFNKRMLNMELPFINFQTISDLCENIIHLPGLRDNPERTYPFTATINQFPGYFPEYTASIIENWKTTEAGKNKIIELSKNLSYIGLASSINTHPIDDANIEILVSKNISTQKNKKPDLVSIADVGLGVSQILPILTALLVAKRNQVVYIEQPEIHLHPRAQVAFAKPLIDAANRGVIVVVETHSSLLLRGIQTAVAKAEIKSKNTSLNWFNKNDKGITHISSTTLDKNGAFGDFPEDFDDINLDAEQAYLDAVEENYAKKAG